MERRPLAPGYQARFTPTLKFGLLFNVWNTTQ
jgi:hypothetical protein